MANAIMNHEDENGKTERVEMLINKMKYNMLDTCLIAREIMAGELWLYAENRSGGIGYDSPYDFVAERLGIKWRQFEKYSAIAQAFLGEKKVREELFNMSVDTLYQMTQLPGDTREQIVSEGAIELASGDIVSIVDLVELGNPQVKKEIEKLKEQVKQLKKSESKLNTNISELERNESMYEEKIKILERENEHLQKLNDIPADERDFHRKITRSGEVRRRLIDVKSMMLAAFMQIKQIEINDDNRDIALAGIKGIITMLVEAMTEVESGFDLSLARQKGKMLELVD